MMDDLFIVRFKNSLGDLKNYFFKINLYRYDKEKEQNQIKRLSKLLIGSVIVELLWFLSGIEIQTFSVFSLLLICILFGIIRLVWLFLHEKKINIVTNISIILIHFLNHFKKKNNESFCLFKNDHIELTYHNAQIQYYQIEKIEYENDTIILYIRQNRVKSIIYLKKDNFIKGSFDTFKVFIENQRVY